MAVDRLHTSLKSFDILLTCSRPTNSAESYAGSGIRNTNRNTGDVCTGKVGGRDIGYYKENLKIHTGDPSLNSSLTLPFPSSPPLPSTPSPLPLPSYIPLSLEVGPLNLVRGPGERCKLPQRGLGWSPSRNRYWCIFALKSDIWWQRF